MSAPIPPELVRYAMASDTTPLRVEDHTAFDVSGSLVCGDVLRNHIRDVAAEMRSQGAGLQDEWEPQEVAALLGKFADRLEGKK